MIFLMDDGWCFPHKQKASSTGAIAMSLILGT